MKTKEIDIATRIYNLSLEIKHLVEHYHINKDVVIEDFKDLIISKFVGEEDENN